MKKRILSLVLALCMLVELLPALILAAEPGDGVRCVHVHDEGCGYVAAVPEQPCGHVHDEACGYTAPREGTPCAHVHDESCGFVEAVAEVPCDLDCEDTDGDGEIDHAADCAYTPAIPEQPCTHVHDETCGYAEAVEEQPCTHIHDESCGWAPAVEGHPCNHVCTVESGCLDIEPGTDPSQEDPEPEPGDPFQEEPEAEDPGGENPDGETPGEENPEGADAAQPAVNESLQIMVQEADAALTGAGYSVVLMVPGEWDGYDWQLWAGAADGWTSLGVEDPVLPVFKEMFVSFAFRCVVEKDGV